MEFLPITAFIERSQMAASEQCRLSLITCGCCHEGRKRGGQGAEEVVRGDEGGRAGMNGSSVVPQTAYRKRLRRFQHCDASKKHTTAWKAFWVTETFVSVKQSLFADRVLSFSFFGIF